MMKILLINISLRPTSEKVIFPIGLGYVATAIANAGFPVEVFDLDVLRPSDEEIENFLKNRDFDVVCMGCIVTGYKYVKKLCGMIKKYKDVPIIVGNSVADSIPKVLMNKTYADIGVIGEGDITIIELLDALDKKKDISEVKGIFFKKDGEIKLTGKRDPIKNLDEIPIINYELFDMDVYLKKCKLNVLEPYPIDFDKIISFPLVVSRGCPFNCSFCYHVFKEDKYRKQSLEKIGKEINFLKRRYGVNYIEFYDEINFISKKDAEDFADYLIKNKFDIFWFADIRANLFDRNDIHIVDKLKKSGCISLCYSLESGDEIILKEMNKNITVEQFIEQTKVIKKAGIVPTTSLVFGYPQETKDTIQKTLDICRDLDVYPSVGYILPQPKTPIYNYAVENNFIRDEEEYLLKVGDRQDFTINLTKMIQEEIEQLVNFNLRKIKEKMGLLIDESKLIKTEHYLGIRKED